MNAALLKIACGEIGVSEKTSAKYHLVQPKQTLYSIGVEYNVSVPLLKKWNDLSDNTILIGQQLRVTDRDSTLNISNPRILQYAKDCGFTDYNNSDVSWCSLFMNWVAFKAGLQRSKSLSARSWINSGREVQELANADIVVYWRESKEGLYGHVGIPLSHSDDKQFIYTLGGNQSDMVCVKPYPANRVLAFIKL